MAGDQLAKDELEKLSHETGKPINLLVNDLANGEALPVKPLKRPYKDYRKAVKGRRGRRPMTDEEKAARKAEAARKKSPPEPIEETKQRKTGRKPRSVKPVKTYDLDEMTAKPSDEELVPSAKALLHGGGRRSIIDKHWDKILKCCYNGWSFKAIGKAIGISSQAMSMYFKRNPEKYELLANARMRLHDEMMDVLVAHAKSGRSNSWLPAITILERLFWTTWCRPEVKIQLMQLEQNSNETVQTFGGKTLQELAREIRQTHANNPNFQKAVEKLQGTAKKLEDGGLDAKAANIVLGTDDPSQEGGHDA